MDYIASSAEFLFEGAPQQMCVEINIIDDDLLDPMESFLVILNTTLTSRTVSLNPQYIFVTITDDERKLRKEDLLQGNKQFVLLWKQQHK